MAASLLDVTPGGEICAMRARVYVSRAFFGRGCERRCRCDASSPSPKSVSFVFLLAKNKNEKFRQRKEILNIAH